MCVCVCVCARVFFLFLTALRDIRYATVAFDATNSSFLLLVQQTHSEAFEPMDKLRKIVLGTVFGTVGIVLVNGAPGSRSGLRPY